MLSALDPDRPRARPCFPNGKRPSRALGALERELEERKSRRPMGDGSGASHMVPHCPLGQRSVRIYPKSSMSFSAWRCPMPATRRDSAMPIAVMAL